MGNVVQNITVKGIDPNEDAANFRVNGEVDAFTTNATLTNGASFDSGIVDLDHYQFFATEIASDQNGELVGTWYDDASGTNALRTFTLPYITSEELSLTSTPKLSRYLKYVFTNNSGSNQTRMHLRVNASNESYSGQILKVDQFIPSNVLAQLVRSVSVGQQPDGDYENTPADGTAITTSSTLAADATYTSAWVDSDGWNSIDLFMTSDVVSAFQGVEVEFTDDAQAGSPTVRATKKYTFSDTDVELGFVRRKIPPMLDGFRVKYTNGSTIQGSFFLDATLKTEGENTLFNQAGATLTSSIETEISLGRVDGYASGDKFGRVKNIDAADSAVDIWAFADDTASPRANTKTFPSTASTFYLASSSTSDTSVSVTVEYIDSTGAEASAVVALNGRTGVSLGDTGLDVNRMYVSGATAAVGNVYVCTANNFSSGTPATPSECLAVMPIGYNQTQLSQFTVPLGKTLLITSYRIEMQRGNGSAGSAEVTLRIKKYGGVSLVKREFFPTSSISVDQTGLNIVVPARAQIVWRLDDVSDNDTNVSCVWSYELIDD